MNTAANVQNLVEYEGLRDFNVSDVMCCKYTRLGSCDANRAFLNIDHLSVIVDTNPFVNRTVQLWNQLPADVLETLSCKPSNFRKRVRKVINKAK
jgi:hypothetical protein